nr:hypothetical protein [Tanacetum cinerariifolium]
MVRLVIWFVDLKAAVTSNGLTSRGNKEAAAGRYSLVTAATRLSNSIAVHRDDLMRKFYDMRSASKVFDEIPE